MHIFGLGLVSIALLALWVFCVVDVVTSDESGIRNLPKIVWLFLVPLIPTVGSVVWLVAGRPQRGPTARHPSTSGTPRFPEYHRPGRHIASRPDDDEEFLRRCRERAEEQRRAAKRKREEQDGQGSEQV